MPSAERHKHSIVRAGKHCEVTLIFLAMGNSNHAPEPSDKMKLLNG